MPVHEPIKQAFDAIHAPQARKARTVAYVKARATLRSAAPRRTGVRRLAVAACLLVAACLVGAWAYLTPTAVISIDVNPSLELGINRFDRVVSVTPYNEDGRQLAQDIQVMFTSYESALEQVLQEQDIIGLLSRQEEMEITVVCANGAQGERLYAGVTQCTAGQQNVFCAQADPQLLEQAHEAGLSCGKYKAYLQAKEVLPDLTPEDVQNMTMRQLRELAGQDVQAGLGAGAQGQYGRGASSGATRGRGYGRNADAQQSAGQPSE